VSSGPIPVERLAKSLGAEVRYQSLKGDLSGFLYRDGKRVVIGVNSHHPTTRQHFTVAHELGHLLLHGPQGVYVDHDFKLRLRSDISSQGVDEEEIEANLFAAELLMPDALLHRDLRKLGTLGVLRDDAIQRLANKYGVSPQALLIRLGGLGYIRS
jgi:Zn-dependent peptidase ImmA (M78 family)